MTNEEKSTASHLCRNVRAVVFAAAIALSLIAVSPLPDLWRPDPPVRISVAQWSDPVLWP
jgi:hypothetical protein